MGLIGHTVRCQIVAALAVALGPTLVAQASINYGNFGPVPPGISFIGVTEDSLTDAPPLYGAPSSYPIGLDFDPLGFVAFKSGAGSDTTNGELKFTLTSSLLGVRIDTIGL